MATEDDIKCPCCGHTKFEPISIYANRKAFWLSSKRRPSTGIFFANHPIEAFRCNECEYILIFAREK